MVLHGRLGRCEARRRDSMRTGRLVRRWSSLPLSQRHLLARLRTDERSRLHLRASRALLAGSRRRRARLLRRPSVLLPDAGRPGAHSRRQGVLFCRWRRSHDTHFPAHRSCRPLRRRRPSLGLPSRQIRRSSRPRGRSLFGAVRCWILLRRGRDVADVASLRRTTQILSQAGRCRPSGR